MFVNDGGTMRPLKGADQLIDSETLELLQKTNDISPITVLSYNGVLDRRVYMYVVWYHIIDGELVVHCAPKNHRFAHIYRKRFVIGDHLYLIEFEKDSELLPKVTKHTLAHYYVYSIVYYDGKRGVLGLTEEGQTMLISEQNGSVKEAQVSDLPELQVLYEHNIDPSWWLWCGLDELHTIKLATQSISSQELPVVACYVQRDAFVIATDEGISSYTVDKDHGEAHLTYYYPTTNPVVQLRTDFMICEDGSVWRHEAGPQGEPIVTKIDQCEPSSHSVRPYRKQPLPC
jgi:hypothetical protein